MNSEPYWMSDPENGRLHSYLVIEPPEEDEYLCTFTPFDDFYRVSVTREQVQKIVAVLTKLLDES